MCLGFPACSWTHALCIDLLWAGTSLPQLRASVSSSCPGPGADPVPTSPRAAAAAWVGEETTTCLVFMLGGAWPLLSFIFITMPGCSGLLAQLLPAGDGSALLRTDPLIPQGRACCLSLGSFCLHVKTGGRAKICPGSPGCDSSSLHHLDLRELLHCLSRFPLPKPGQLLRVPTVPWCCTACGEVLGWV